jgi:hypothetical protein
MNTFVCDCGRHYKPSAKYKDSRVKCNACLKTTTAAEVKARAVEYLGGKCVDCKGQFPPVAYDFDHRDPSTKDFKISGNYIFRWDVLKRELDKTDLRCAVCHRIRHYMECNDVLDIPNKKSR